MKLCYYCHTPFMEQVSWQTVFGLSQANHLCPTCEKKLERITGEICKICGRPYTTDAKIFTQKQLCNDCIKWEENKEWKGLLAKNRSLYVYNEFLKQVIARFKYRGDAELVKIFSTPLKQLLKQFPKNAQIVPIPLSAERLYERGFNQAELLANLLGEVTLALKHVGDIEKQSKKSRKQRLDNFKKSSFVLCENVNKHIRNHDIIIVDDIYTTGVTIRHGARVLLENGAKSVSSITVARS